MLTDVNNHPFTKEPIMKYVVILIVLIGAPLSFGEENLNHQSHMAPYEFGLSLESFTLKDEHHTETAPGVHFHLIKKLDNSGFFKDFGIGLGGEFIFSDEVHYGAMVSLAYYPWRELAIIVSPGYEFAKHDGNTENAFAMHYELSYAFEINGIHMGPVVSFSETDHSEHYSFGWHFGF